MALGRSAFARSLPSLLSTLLVAGALSAAVFYHGPQIPLLAGAQALLILWLLTSLLHSYDDGVRLPNTVLAASLTLFWGWLGVSLAWSRVPAVSTVTFWWVGSMALVFWIYTLSPARAQIWNLVARFALLGAVALAVMALVQLLVYGQPARATFINIHSFAALLMLVVVPACAYLLIALGRRAGWAETVALGIAVFLIIFVIAATRGRGTTISLLISIAVLLAFMARSAPRRHLALIAGLVGGAYLLANLSLHGALADRFSTLTDPADAALPRLLIWRGSWEMVLDNPWYGIGLGIYYLAWPPYRDPADATLGFFAHNDYLQLWIETGLPGLLLLLAVFLSVLVMTIRFLRLPAVNPTLRTEVVGLFCGLLAVAAHTFLDFNFYILPISIVSGLILGRFHERVVSALPSGSLMLQPLRFIRRPAYHTIVALLVLFPLSYLTALGLSDYFYHQGLALAGAGKLQDADRAFSQAEQLTSSDDKAFLAHADLYRHSLRRMPQDAHADRLALYEAALGALDRTEQYNPYRAMAHTVRGNLYRENRDLAGANWSDQAERAYAQALALNPRFYGTRMAYAQILLENGRADAARTLLDQGAQHWYYPEPMLLAYFALTAALHRDAGEIEQAQRFEARVSDIRSALGLMAPVRPIARDPEVAPPDNRSVP